MKLQIEYNNTIYEFVIPNWKITLDICNKCIEIDEFGSIYTNGIKEKRLFLNECLKSHNLNDLNIQTIDYIWSILKSELFLTDQDQYNLIKQSTAYIANEEITGMFDPVLLETSFLHKGHLNFNLEELNNLTNKQIEKINCVLKVFNE